MQSSISTSGLRPSPAATVSLSWRLTHLLGLEVSWVRKNLELRLLRDSGVYRVYVHSYLRNVGKRSKRATSHTKSTVEKTNTV